MINSSWEKVQHSSCSIFLPSSTGKVDHHSIINIYSWNLAQKQLTRSAFGPEGFYRLSFCKIPQDIKRGMEQLEKAYKKVIEELGNKKSEKEENKEKNKFPENNNIIFC